MAFNDHIQISQWESVPLYALLRVMYCTLQPDICCAAAPHSTIHALCRAFTSSSLWIHIVKPTLLRHVSTLFVQVRTLLLRGSTTLCPHQNRNGPAPPRSRAPAAGVVGSETAINEKGNRTASQSNRKAQRNTVNGTPHEAEHSSNFRTSNPTRVIVLSSIIRIPARQ